MPGSQPDVERSTIMYDPSESRLTVESEGNSVETNLARSPARFEMQDEDGNLRSALWLTDEEASVLDKMVAYILDKVKITESSKSALEGLRPSLRRIVETRE